MRGLTGLLAGVLVGLVFYHLVMVTGLSVIAQHFRPQFATSELRLLAAEENRKTPEVLFATIIALGGIALTCTVGYLAVPQERFSEAARRLANEVFSEMYVAAEERSGQLNRARHAIDKGEPTRPCLIAFSTLIGIHSIAPWTFRPNKRQRESLGSGLRNAWRGTRICAFVRGSDVTFVACLAGVAAVAVLFAAVFMVRLVALDANVDGPWPVITDLAQIATLCTVVSLIMVIGIAVARALTALSVRRAIDEARDQEAGRLADEATNLMSRNEGADGA